MAAITPANLRTTPEQARRAVVPVPGGRQRPVAGRAQAAAHGEAPITSGKAPSMRPPQMRGVLRLGGRPIRGRPDDVHRRRIHPHALRATARPKATSCSLLPLIPRLDGVHRPWSRTVAGTAASGGGQGLDAAVRLARTPDRDIRMALAGPAGGRGSSRSLAHGVAGTGSVPGRLGFHVTGRRPPVLTRTQPVFRNSPYLADLVHARYRPASALAELRGVLTRPRRSPQTSSGLGTRHRKGESAVGVSTNSATPTIWLMSKPSMSARNSGLDRYACNRC